MINIGLCPYIYGSGREMVQITKFFLFKEGRSNKVMVCPWGGGGKGGGGG